MQTYPKNETIPLTRELRPIVKAHTMALPGWPEYARANGFDGRAHLMVNGDWRAACNALGVDIAALAAGAGKNTGKSVQAAPPMARDAADNAAEDMADNAAEDMADNAADNEAAPAAPAEPTGDDTMPATPSDFEGRDIAEIISETLAPASAHLTPYLAGLLPDLLAPLAELAAQGPRIVRERETIVLDNKGNAVGQGGAVALPHVRVTGRANVAKLFGVAKSSVGKAYKHAMDTIELTVCECRTAPHVDTEYVWQVDTLAQLAICDAAGMNAWIYGHKGTGKTEGAAQYAARLGRPFVRIAINRETSPAELIGQELPTPDGGTAWRDGLLTRAFRIPHCVVLIDEPTLLRSGSLAVFQTALDTREIYLPHGEVVKAAAGLFVIAADNTAGVGDESGVYVDTAAINGALLDRFALRIQVDFLPAAKEAAMLANRAGLAHGAALKMVEYAALTRSDASAGKLTIGVTFRRLAAWARAVQLGLGSEAAFSAAVLSGATPEDREPLAMLARGNIRHSDIDALARGANPESVAAQATRHGNVSDSGMQFPVDD